MNENAKDELATELVTELVTEEDDIFSDDSLQNQLNALNKETNPEIKKALRLRLVQDIVTRWNSTYFMLESVYKSHKAIVTVIEKETKRAKKYKSSLLDYKVFNLLFRLINYKNNLNFSIKNYLRTSK